MKIAIIGMGVVGRAQARMFSGHELRSYDPADDDYPYPYDAVKACDFAVIAAGTPPLASGAADLSGLRTAMDRLHPAMPVLIRSTVPPGTTGALAGTRDGITAHAPDFMYESKSGPWQESADVPWMLLGGRNRDRDFFRDRLAAVFPGVIHECSALTAELAKYTANLYWAARVTFVNEMAGICSAFGADWEVVRKAWLADERVGPAYTGMKGFGPGFGGRCWPKDLSALITASAGAGYGAEFLRDIEAANERFREYET